LQIVLAAGLNVPRQPSEGPMSTTTLIIILLVFLLFGGGWGYSRRGR
jgi:hypothetical protein